MVISIRYGPGDSKGNQIPSTRQHSLILPGNQTSKRPSATALSAKTKYMLAYWCSFIYEQQPEMGE
jgi:hypothetical protein